MVTTMLSLRAAILKVPIMRELLIKGEQWESDIYLHLYLPPIDGE